MKPDNFFSELKRRNVIRMAGLYLVAAWFLIQVAGTVLPMFGAPDWLPRSIVILLVIGFVPALIFSWVFELTPEGLKRDAEVKPERSIAPQTGRRMDRMIIAVLVLALGYFAFDKFFLAPERGKTASGKEADAGVSAKSIAVLPFESLSEEKANAYFADGIQDEILTKLASIADLKVISRTSTAKYKSKPEDLKTVSQQLGVAHVLEGSVQKAGEKVRVNVQLIDARVDSHVWAKSYDGDAKDVFAVETEVSQQVADALRARLSADESSTIATAPTDNHVAYDLFLRGEYEERRAEDSVQKASYDQAAKWYEQAIAADPNFALAIARLVQNRIQCHWFFEKLNPPQMEELKSRAEHAIALAPRLAEAQIAFGTCWYYGYRDYDRALAAFAKAVELQPNNTGALEYSGYVHRRQGRWEKSLAELEQSLERDPRNAALAGNIAGSYCALRMWPQGVTAARRAIEIDPHASDGMSALLEATVNGGGDIDEALRILHTFPSDSKLVSSGAGTVESILGQRASLYILARDFANALKVWESADGDERRQLSARSAINLLANHKAEAAAEAAKAKPPLEGRLRQVPDDFLAMTQLEWVYLALDRPADALTLARKIAEALPPARDALFGPSTIAGLAQVEARTGASGDAIARLRQSLANPGDAVTSADLRVNPVWDPLRDQSGFEELLRVKELVGPGK